MRNFIRLYLPMLAVVVAFVLVLWGPGWMRTWNTGPSTDAEMRESVEKYWQHLPPAERDALARKMSGVRDDCLRRQAEYRPPEGNLPDGDVRIPSP